MINISELAGTLKRYGLSPSKDDAEVLAKRIADEPIEKKVKMEKTLTEEQITRVLQKFADLFIKEVEEIKNKVHELNASMKGFDPRMQELNDRIVKLEHVTTVSPGEAKTVKELFEETEQSTEPTETEIKEEIPPIEPEEFEPAEPEQKPIEEPPKVEELPSFEEARTEAPPEQKPEKKYGEEDVDLTEMFNFNK